jgi:hypothetical protein
MCGARVPRQRHRRVSAQRVLSRSGSLSLLSPSVRSGTVHGIGHARVRCEASRRALPTRACLVGQGANSEAGTPANSTNSPCSVGDAQFYRYVPPTLALWSAGGIDASAR